MDTNFEKILTALKEIHEAKPDLSFGMVLQTSMDRFKQTNNVDFHQLNSKQILKSIKQFKNSI